MLATALLFSISACQATEETVQADFLTTVKTKEFNLELYNEQDRCAIKFNNAPEGKLLNIPYPCGFVRATPTSTAQTYHYDDTGHVFVIAGPLADKSNYKTNDSVSAKHKCSNSGQAVIIKEGQLILQKGQHITPGFCHHLGFDEKDYYGFSHPVD